MLEESDLAELTRKNRQYLELRVDRPDKAEKLLERSLGVEAWYE